MFAECFSHLQVAEALHFSPRKDSSIVSTDGSLLERILCWKKVAVGIRSSFGDFAEQVFATHACRTFSAVFSI